LSRRPSKAQIDTDPLLYLQFFIAETLGMTLAEIRQKMTREELYAWSAYLSLKADREEKAHERARREAQYRRVR
jgi:hypothetical protein